MSAYGEMGPGVVIPLPPQDDEEECADCGEYLDDCTCDDECSECGEYLSSCTCEE